MPYHKGWLPREGFTSDALGPILKKTLLNPALTLPLVLLARYTKQGENLRILHETAFSRLKLLLYFGAARWAVNWLNDKSLNNWVEDKYVWSNEIVVITGGAGGIGGEVVKLLAEKGIKIVVLDVIPMTFETPSNVHYYKCDITSSSTIASVAAKIRSDVGTPTILINNAGVARGKDILTATEKDVRFTFDVNTIAHYLLAKEFLPAMVKANHGMIVTVASIAAYVTVPNMTDYASSKAAAMSFHEGLSAELKTRFAAPRVRTVLINQGYTKTALFQGYHNDSPFLVPTLEVGSVAQGIAEAVLAGRSCQVILPGFANMLGIFRGMPQFYQFGVRTKGAEIMTKWHGRQVIDVEKDYKIAGEKDVSDSTVLVSPAGKDK